MKEWKDQGVIIRLGHFHEADLWIKLLLKEHGLHTVYAFGAAKSKRRFCGCLDTLNWLDCRVKISRCGRYLTLEEASLLAAARNLRVNWQNMGITANCLRFVEALPISPDISAKCFAIVHNLHDYMERQDAHPKLIPLFFRLLIATAAGFAPNFDSCGQCGLTAGADGYFIASEGRYFCGDCASSLSFSEKRYALKLGARPLELLRAARFAFPTAAQEDALSNTELRQCAAIIDGFVQYHMGLVWNNGYFRQI